MVARALCNNFGHQNVINLCVGECEIRNIGAVDRGGFSIQNLSLMNRSLRPNLSFWLNFFRPISPSMRRQAQSEDGGQGQSVARP